MTKQLYFLRDTRSTVGNSVVWWAHNGRGYTCDIRRAKIFTQEQIDKHDRESDKPYRIQDVIPLAQHHIDHQDLDDKEKRLRPWTMEMEGLFS